MRYLLALLSCLFFINIASAKHVKGGWIQYEYQGAGTTSGTSVYKVTVTIFYGCNVQGPRSPITLMVYDAVTNAQTTSVSLATATSTTVTKGTYSPCMSNPPTICYEVYTYTTTLTLTNNTNGYILSVVDQYRTASIINITNSSSDGIAFTANIPGTINGIDYHNNNSPSFLFKDTAIVCYNGNFIYQFSAVDNADNDSLSYSFGNGLNYTTSAAPPYAALTYVSGYSGQSPMGSGVTIDPVTGTISGTAPSTTGEYVIAVYVTEWRNGVAIDSIKKELQIYVYDCSLAAASLNASYINCDNYTFSFQNLSTASAISSYLWDFGVANSTKDTSTSPTPTYTYADTGTYTIKLTVSNTTGCTDSTTAAVKVYPGFTPSFTVTGSCYQSPFQFTDASYVKYGNITSWSWDFGDASVTTDTSSSENPTYQYGSPGTYTAVLNIASSKGCTGSYSKTVTANAKPAIYLPFTDTLICSIDSLPLIVQSTGTYSWTPLYNIINPTTANPVVYPKDTTVYTITVQDKGCVDSATVTVNVLDFVTVKLSADTGICKTDTITLQPVSYALRYLWTESGNGNTLSSYTVKNPQAYPTATTTYYVTANLGKCQDASQITVHVSPYPTAYAGIDTTICFGSTARLNGSTTGSAYYWSPASSLLNSNTLQPTAGPSQTTSYILTATDTLYCPKPVSDKVVVTVIPPIQVNAGNDTVIVIGQPLQLQATANNTTVSYTWSPNLYMNNDTIYDPIVTITSSYVDSIIYTVTATTPEGCTGYDDIKVIVFKTNPDIFIPTGFTPNGDGRNDVLKPTLVGIKQFDFFRVYNRWGQLLYTTNEIGKGWDGRISGVLQDNGTYVFTAQGIDYLGNTIFKKGTVVLIK